MDIDYIISLFDVIPYLQDKGIDIAEDGPEVTQGWVGIPCLWCDDRGHHLGINIEGNAVSCWKCGKKSIVKLVRAIENDCGFYEALEIMEKYLNPSRLANYIPTEKTHKHSISIPSHFTRLRWPNVPKIVQDYLIKRGFEPEKLVLEKELYYGTHIGKFAFRIIMPVYLNHKLVTYVGRAIIGSNHHILAYKALEEEESVVPSKSTLYGHDDVPPGSNVVIVEGPIDQWKLGPGSVATFGTQWTMDQVHLLRELSPNKVFILYDSEEDAQKAAKALSDQIWFCESEVLMLNGVNDPGDLSPIEGKWVMENIGRVK